MSGYLVKANGIFVEKKDCKNPEWIQLKFKLDEVYKDNLISADSQKYPNFVATIPTAEWADYDYLQRNQVYCLDLVTKLEPANGNYPAKMSFIIYGVSAATRELQTA